MDLVEIRKRAKALKGKKGESKPEALPPVEAVSPEKPPAETPSEETKKRETAVKKKAVAAPEPEESLLTDEAEAFLASAEPSVEAKETDDFLSSVLGALYQEGYDAEAAAAEVDEDRLELLCFMLSDEEYAVDIRDVKEIIKMADITEVPKVPPFMLGIISLRGVIIPLLDLRKRLALESSGYTPKTRIIIVSVGEASMGMVVDSVTEVVRLKKTVMEPPPAFLNNLDASLLEGVGRYEERLLIIPNIERVFDLSI